MYIYGCMYKHLGLFVFFWQHANGKISMLVHARKDLSSSDVINIERILEGVHLRRNIFTLHNECTIVEIV